MSLRKGRSMEFDFIPTLPRASSQMSMTLGGGGGRQPYLQQIQGTLVYLVEHERIASILNESEHVLQLPLNTRYKKSMGDDGWMECTGIMNLYQLDGPEGHRFVLSLSWEREWHKKLQKVFGVRISEVEKHQLLSTLCKIEDEKRLRQAFLFNTLNVFDDQPQNENQPSKSEDSADSTEQSSDKPADSNNAINKRNRPFSTIPEEESEDEYGTLRRKIESSVDTDASSVTLQEGGTRPASEYTLPPLEEKDEESGKLRSDTTTSEELPLDSAAESSKTSNGDETSVTVEVHTDNNLDFAEADGPLDVSSDSSLRKDIGGTSDTTTSSPNKQSDENSPEKNTIPNGNAGLSRRATETGIPPSKNSAKSSSVKTPTTRHLSLKAKPGQPKNHYRYPLSPDTERQSILAKLFSRFKRKSKKKYKIGDKKGSDRYGEKNLSRSALYETMSLKSTYSYDTLNFPLARQDSTSTLQSTNKVGSSSYNRKYFKGKPASMHVLTRDRKFVPLYDVMNCLLEFYDVMRPVKVIGVTSAESKKQTLGENQILEIINFLEKPINAELRSTRKDYILYNSVVKSRSFTNSEFRLLMAD